MMDRHDIKWFIQTITIIFLLVLWLFCVVITMILIFSLRYDGWDTTIAETSPKWLLVAPILTLVGFVFLMWFRIREERKAFEMMANEKFRRRYMGRGEH